MINSLHNNLQKKLWETHTNREAKTLFQLLFIWIILGVASVLYLTYNLLFHLGDFCIICNLVLLVLSVLAIICSVSGRIKCALNVVFAIPLVVYAFYFSDFNAHAPLNETIINTLTWLMAGFIFLIFLSPTNSRIRNYFLFGLLTLGFHIIKANLLFDSFFKSNPVITHPLFIYVFLSLAFYLLRLKLNKVIKIQDEEINAIKQSVSKVLQDSGFSIAQLKAERDEAGNIMHFTIERVNNTFESAFKINLYEVQDQKADYIFDLIFKHKFELNKVILTKQKRYREFHAVQLERWFNIHVLQPDYNQFFLIFEDITKIKDKIAELEESKRRYKVLLEAIPDIFFVIDKDGTYEDFVIKESDLFKVEDSNIIGSTIFDVGFPDNMADKIYSCIQTSIKTNSIESIEYQMNTPNGTFLFEMRLAKLNNHAVISVARDITKRKTAEFKLEKALVKAEESDRLKSAFLANLSHEIRTPMNVITNFTRMLADTDLDREEKLEITDAISQNGKQLMNMIDNTIHLSKIETQTVQLEYKFCAINSVLRDIYNQYLIIIPDSKHIRLQLKIDVPNKEFGFETDPAILKETISLLVDNAVKYTQRGEVIISYEMIRNEWIKFTVSDTGIGIPSEEFKNIFRRFYRVANEINESTSGSGLGLPIVQHYVALLGGELEFKSEPGNGSSFWFALPFTHGKGFLSVVK